MASCKALKAMARSLVFFFFFLFPKNIGKLVEVFLSKKVTVCFNMTIPTAIWRTDLGRNSKYKEASWEIIAVVQGEITMAIEMKKYVVENWLQNNRSVYMWVWWNSLDKTRKAMLVEAGWYTQCSSSPLVCKMSFSVIKHKGVRGWQTPAWKKPLDVIQVKIRLRMHRADPTF